MASKAVLLVALAIVRGSATSEGFLRNHGQTHSMSLKVRAEEFQAAANAVMGCGGGDGSSRLAEVERVLKPLWNVVPKNRHGNVEWRMLRYLAHRYFMQQFSLLIRGLEPARKVNDSHIGEAEILNEKVPGFVEVLRSGTHQNIGFSLGDATALVATLERLIYDSETATLEEVYRQNRLSVSDDVSSEMLFTLVEEYVVNWMLDEDPRTIHRAMRNHSLLAEIIPRWEDVRHFARGAVRAQQLTQQRAPTAGHYRAGFANLHSSADAHQVITHITQGFASFWEAECQSIKTSLMELDTAGSGRVSLAHFYGANVDGEWRFGESESYLKELGALEEGTFGTKQVLIPNYLQGASNCIVARDNYLVCCMNECESYLNEIEDTVGGPVAKAEVILDLVQNMTNFEDDGPRVDQKLQAQLRRIADTHGGNVPIHGRLFAQWMHYVFPHECAFPHKAGTVRATSIDEFGSQSYAASSEIESQAALRNDTSAMVHLESVEEAQWMSQWSEEEELHADYGLELRTPWDMNKVAIVSVLGMAALAIAGVGSRHGGQAKADCHSVVFEPKAHFV